MPKHLLATRPLGLRGYSPLDLKGYKGYMYPKALPPTEVLLLCNFLNMRFSTTAFVISTVFATLAAAYPGPGYVTGSIDVHDPTICRDSAGVWWLFATAPGISIRKSTDRKNWQYVGLVWPNGQATWTNTYTGTSNGNLWAPDCTYRDGQFWLYYSTSSFGSNKSAIFLAKSSTAQPGSWSNQGLVTSTTTSNDYNAIDPHLFIEGSNWYLSLGSFWTGIKQVKLSSSTGKPTSSSFKSIAKRTANSGAVEAPIIFKYGSYYYLFISWDNCCAGTSSTYNIRVGRASSPTGTYKDKNGVSLVDGGGTLILPSHDGIIGPGGQHVYQDSDAVVLNYHYYTSSGAKLGINLLDFSSGWPVVY